MSYQFIHYEDYSVNKSKKKTNREEKRIKEQKEAGVYKSDYNSETEGNDLRSIIAEAKREPGNIPSTVIDGFKEPEILYGLTLDEVEEMALSYHANTKIKDKNGKEKKLRKDANIILAGVVSLNRKNEEIWDDYKKSSIEYLKSIYGHKLKSVIEHTDEKHPHFHFYVLQDEGEVFDLIHEGKKAALEAKKENKIKGDQNRAYINAMREYQSDFFLNVASKYGLTKDGPKRARISREDYLKQQREIELLNKIRKNQELELIKSKEKAKKEIEELKEKAKIEIEEAKKNATAVARRIGKAEGFKSAIIDFKGKNVFGKAVFSRTFNNEMIEKLQKKNKDLIIKNKDLFDRKEKYKKDASYKYKYIEEKNKNEYLNDINEILETDKENKDDIRKSIIREIERVEKQQREIDLGCSEIKSRNVGNRGSVKEFKERFRRSFRLLFNTIKTACGNIFSTELFKERSERKEENEQIKTSKKDFKNENEKIKRNERKRKNRTI